MVVTYILWHIENLIANKNYNKNGLKNLKKNSTFFCLGAPKPLGGSHKNSFRSIKKYFNKILNMYFKFQTFLFSRFGGIVNQTSVSSIQTNWQLILAIFLNLQKLKVLNIFKNVGADEHFWRCLLFHMPKLYEKKLKKAVVLQNNSHKLKTLWKTGFCNFLKITKLLHKSLSLRNFTHSKNGLTSENNT